MSSVEDVEYLDILSFKSNDTSIYHPTSETPILTVCIGAKCSDGFVLIADRKLTDLYGGQPRVDKKIFGDLSHILTAYAGNVVTFDMFRKYMVGDVIISERMGDPYKFDDFIRKTSTAVERFNKVKGGLFEVLIERHQRDQSDLHWINFKGSVQKVDYKAIGSGEEMANKFCAKIQYDRTMTMKEFTKRAYLAIMYMDKYCLGLGVGVEANGIPDIKYLDKNEEWDVEPVKDRPEDIEECKKYANQKLEEFGEAFQKIVK